MNHRVRCLAGLASAAALLVGSTAPAAPDHRPNVVLIMTDDQGYGDYRRFTTPPNVNDQQFQDLMRRIVAAHPATRARESS